VSTKALWRLREAENAFLRHMGWVPVDEWDLDGDWRRQNAGDSAPDCDRAFALNAARTDAERESE
jgi:hypothetical protein